MVMFSRVAAVLACMVVPLALAPPVLADPDPAPPPADAAAAAPEGAPEAAPPPDDGRIASAAPATTKTPDGWTLTISSKDETLLP
ncbi:MAG TPA: MspA protein, partial [Mycobacterium sp.]|nr:MspA protein [Mycobacterium sp.]